MKFVYAAPLLLVAAAAEHPADCRMKAFIKAFIENEVHGYKTETVGVGLFMTSVFTSKGKNGSITTIAVDDRGGGGELGGGLGGGPQPFVKQFQRGDLLKEFYIEYDKDPSAPDAKVTYCNSNDWDPDEDTVIKDIAWDDSKSVQFGSNLNAFVGVFHQVGDDLDQQLVADFDADGICYPIQIKIPGDTPGTEFITTFTDLNGNYDETYEVPEECNGQKEAFGKNLRGSLGRVMTVAS